MSLLETYQKEMNEAVEQIINKVEDLSEDVIRHKPSKEEWSIMEIICHVEEVIPYWMDELVRVVEAKGTEWGRGLQDEARLAAVAQSPMREVPDVLKGIKEAQQYANDQWTKLSDQDLALEAPHRNPKFGVKPMTFLVEHFITEHLFNHGKQIDRNLSKINEQ
ncbi:DinB family protein [Halalkalibacter krulwichiae]|uniref:DinB superfamily protein n=1 Tax=Halalkalibacter krulwichiae TaxID=199441 RepID=A0A1X9M932_9BACI|nr:DinB family protein [Halalkalibacter krulwichiae]ARK29906.1 DinB superfamily protein [Halalkalibacter krulwichiae]